MQRRYFSLIFSDTLFKCIIVYVVVIHVDILNISQLTQLLECENAKENSWEFLAPRIKFVSDIGAR